MALAGSIEIQLAADVARLRKDMGDAARIVNSGAAAMNRAAEMARRALGGITAGLAIRELVKMADAVALTDARLRLATKTAKDFAQAQRDVYAIAQSNNVGLRETTTLYAKLAEPVRRLGGSTRETSAIVSSFATSLRISGANTQEAASATLQFAQAMASGKLSGDEFRSLAEASPRFMQALADSMGVPTGALKDMSKEGKLTADVVGNALIKSLTQLRSEAAGLPDTVGGAFQRVQNDAAVLVREFNKLTGMTDGLAGGVGGLSMLLSGLSDVLSREMAEGTQVAGSGFDSLGLSMRVVGTVMETALLIASDVSFMYKAVGREIGGVAAQIVAIGQGDFAGAAVIRQSMVEDARIAATELERYQSRIAEITNRALQQRAALQRLEGSGFQQSDRKFGAGGFKSLRGAAGTADEKAIKAANKELKDQAQLLAELSGVNGDYMEQLTRLQKLRVSQNMSDARYVELVEDLIKKQPGVKKFYDEQEKAEKAAMDVAQARQKARQEEQEQIDKWLADEAVAATKSLKSAEDQLKAIQEETQALGMTNVEREKAIALRELEATGLDKSSAKYKQLAADIAAAVEQREAVRQHKAMWESIDKTAHDVWTNVFEGGNDAFKKLGQTLKAAVLDLLYQLTIKKWIVNISANTSGPMGGLMQMFSGAMGGSGSGAGGGLSMGNLMSMGSSAWSVGGQFLSGSMSGANALGTIGANATGTGLNGLLATNGAYGTAGAGAAGAGLGTMAAGAGAIGVIALAAVKAWESLQGEKRGGGEFAYAPNSNYKTVAEAIADGKGTQFVTGPSGGMPDETKALTTSMLDATVVSINEAFRSFGKDVSVKALQGAWETSQQGRGGVFSGGVLSSGQRFGESGKGSNYNFTGPNDSKFELWASGMFGKGGGFDSDMDGSPEELATDLQQSYLAALQASIGLIPKLIKQQYSASDFAGPGSNTGSAAGSGNLNLAREAFEKNPLPVYLRVFDEEMKHRARDLGLLPKRILDLIIDIDPEKLSAEATQEITAKISAMVAHVNEFRAAVDAMPVAQLRNASFDAAAGLMELQGGIQAFAANLTSFVDNFYSETEKQRFIAGQIQKTLSGAGLNMSVDQILATSRDTFRSIMETLAPDSELYSALLSVNAQFASIAPAAQSAADSLQETQKRLAAMGEGVWNFVRDLKTTRAGTASPQQLLAGTRSAYLQDLALARKNNPEALGRINDSAQAYIEAQKGFTASGGSTQAVISQVIKEMSSLPAVKSFEQQMLEALKTIDVSVNKLPPGFGVEIAQKFSQIDLDGSGGLTFAELKQALGDKATDAQLKAIFAELDKNGDGTISRLEAIKGSLGGLAISLAAKMAEEFSLIDVNASGGITFSEMKLALGDRASDAQLKAIFRELDTNGDGTISKLEAVRGSIGALPAALGARIADNFSLIDINASGGLTFAELKTALGDKATDAQLKAIFKELDVNGDGTISRLESLKGNGTSQVAWLMALNQSVKNMGAMVVGSFEAIDVDISGAVNFSELKAFFGPLASDAKIRELIKIADADKNGSLSKLELINATIIKQVAATNAVKTATDQVKAEVAKQPAKTAILLGGYFTDANANTNTASGIQGYASGGTHSGGLRWVGEQGPELEFTGPSRILSNQDSMRMLAGASGSDEVLRDEVRQLRREVTKLTTVMAEGQSRSIGELSQIRRNTEDDGTALLQKTAVKA